MNLVLKSKIGNDLRRHLANALEAVTVRGLGPAASELSVVGRVALGGEVSAGHGDHRRTQIGCLPRCNVGTMTVR